MPVPVSAGSNGTAPGSGHSTVRRASSTVSRSPVPRRPYGTFPPASRSSHAAYPGPGPRIPGSSTRPMRYRSSSSASPATWSSCGCVRTSASRRRSHGGSRSSRATSSRSGSGPPSISKRPPREPSTRIASPWPTSSTTIVVRPSGRCTTTRPVIATTPTRSAIAARAACAPAVRSRCPPAMPRDADRADGRAASACHPARPSTRRTAVRPADEPTSAITTVAMAAATTAEAGPSSMLASGRPANDRTIATTRASRPHAGRPVMVDTNPGTQGRLHRSARMSSTTAPPISAAAPAAIAGITDERHDQEVHRARGDEQHDEAIAEGRHDHRQRRCAGARERSRRRGRFCQPSPAVDAR